MHKFNPKNKNKLDNEWRRANLPPKETLESLGLKSTDIVADIGCGIGYFSLPAGRIVSSKNNVFAIDMEKEMLFEVNQRVVKENKPNIITMQSTEYDLTLKDESVTFAILILVLHEIEDKKRFIKEVKRVLKPGGKFAIIEWGEDMGDVGPPIDHRIKENYVKELMEEEKFKTDKKLDINNLFYALVGVREW